MEADIDPGECEILVSVNGQQVYKFEDEDANAHVKDNENWIVANCHVLADEELVQALGGPFPKAKRFRNFRCLIENENTEEDVLAEMTHAVLSRRPGNSISSARR